MNRLEMAKGLGLLAIVGSMLIQGARTSAPKSPRKKGKSPCISVKETGFSYVGVVSIKRADIVIGVLLFFLFSATMIL